jgi:hypothetical protein
VSRYAIQRVSDGAYLYMDASGEHWDHNPQNASWTESRDVAQQLIDGRQLVGQWSVAALPSTRPLLSQPMDKPHATTR